MAEHNTNKIEFINKMFSRIGKRSEDDHSILKMVLDWLGQRAHNGEGDKIRRKFAIRLG